MTVERITNFYNKSVVLVNQAVDVWDKLSAFRIERDPELLRSFPQHKDSCSKTGELRNYAMRTILPVAIPGTVAQISTGKVLIRCSECNGSLVKERDKHN